MAKIELENVSVTFTAHQQKRVSFKEYLVRGLFFGSRNPALRVRALEGINLSARDGDRIGVIGHNGAGKSTLLKTLAGVYPPTGGTREVEGKICSLFDITLGFEFEASGWDNILYRAYLQGETPTSVRDKVDQIAEFSELGDFLNIAVRNYSAGMQMRLAFSIATAIEPEVLLIDEVLAVGDLAFQNKAKARMKELMKSSRLMVIVAHDLNAILDMCTRVIWMEHGQIRAEGAPGVVVEQYIAASAANAGVLQEELQAA
ncbi:Teichoic acids export ATP-binding protein TagH [Gemmata obscuriglobus]|uniref:Sugar ABC transporter n=1 Tax=Gemmata obscuriglobus TaxID=114 RepID=A0A2Z3H0L7_9BACT|nr:ABC transporter ATP-binding protein [Gemmata obscuriglobus]AWM39268.1 sugar ABC transporter [Gemmata obscuriglobus]QEG27674.1 Teichoic acids export ATP-binding protein TagH [Gemmata obscuriglobus]VTS04871.1 abc transporter : Sugar ABC transporter OS=Clostridium butyricum GN=OA81_18585 PE=4 SV=1: ABC_tran [Gemmata obscuriglobus UQM 2246]